MDCQIINKSEISAVVVVLRKKELEGVEREEKREREATGGEER